MANPPVIPITPSALPLRDALARSEPLALLQQRLRESNARFDGLRGVLPPALAPHVRPGPLDAQGWTLLAANTAVAAKPSNALLKLISFSLLQTQISN